MHRSANKQKYSRKSRIAQWHLESVMDAIYHLLLRTEGKSVLDAGCGEGFVMSYLARKSPQLKLTGVDLSADAIVYAEDTFGGIARFCTGSLYKLPFSDNAFDVALCSEVLEHLDDPDRAMNELKRVARRYVLITVPNEPYFKWTNNLSRALGYSMDPGHVNFWTKNSFKQFIVRHFDASAIFARKHVIYQMALVKV